MCSKQNQSKVGNEMSPATSQSDVFWKIREYFRQFQHFRKCRSSIPILQQQKGFHFVFYQYISRKVNYENNLKMQIKKYGTCLPHYVNGMQIRHYVMRLSNIKKYVTMWCAHQMQNIHHNHFNQKTLLCCFYVMTSQLTNNLHKSDHLRSCHAILVHKL